MNEQITLTTEDNVQIVAIERRVEGDRAAILLHMMPATKESWLPMISSLADSGYSSIAIDERGHGESTMDGALDYKTFTAQEQQAKILDVQAANQYLLDQGFAQDKIVVIGASIGANLAIQFLAQTDAIPAAVALSPGLDYHGIKTDELVRAISNNQKLMLVASDEDGYSFKSILELNSINPNQTILIEKSGLGHGTSMTDAQPELINEILEFLP